MLRKLLLILMALFIFTTASAQTVSPTTGLPINGEPVAPMLAVISHTSANVEYNGHTTTALGVGKRQAWGGQNADIIYEFPLYKEYTRLAYLFHDALVNGETIEAGPIRSVRAIHVELTKAWNGGLIYGNGLSGNMYGVPQLWEIRDVSFTDGNHPGSPYITSVRGARAPDHRSADVNALHAMLPDQQFRADRLVFTEELPGADLPRAADVKLSWGESKRFFSRFVYDEAEQTYQWYSNKVPLKNWLDSSRTEETYLKFDNVIVQYTPFSYPISLLQPEIDFSLGGKAHIFMGGKVIEGEWINRNGSIHYVDARGYDLPLKCGKTYVAIWPDDWNQLSYK